jgi:hypothetical protein
MKIGVTCHGHQTYGLTLEDYKQSVIMRVGDVYEIDNIVLEVYEIFEMYGLNAKTEEGLFNTDLKGSGTHNLNRVEYPDGEMIHE